MTLLFILKVIVSCVTFRTSQCFHSFLSCPSCLLDQLLLHFIRIYCEVVCASWQELGQACLCNSASHVEVPKVWFSKARRDTFESTTAQGQKILRKLAEHDSPLHPLESFRVNFLRAPWILGPREYLLGI